LLTGEWTAKFSNDLLMNLFNEGGALHEEMKNGFVNDYSTHICKKVEVFVKNKKHNAYFIKFLPSLVIQGINKFYY